MAPTTGKKRPQYVVRASSIHGRGVFAARTIRKGAKVIEYRGERVSRQEADRRPPSDPEDPAHTFLFALSDGTVIDASVRGNAARWINHCCAPNCETIEYDDGRVFIHARRTIRAGEEITYDYRLAVDGRVSERMRKTYACHCAARRCRGTLLIERKPRGRQRRR